MPVSKTRNQLFLAAVVAGILMLALLLAEFWGQAVDNLMNGIAYLQNVQKAKTDFGFHGAMMTAVKKYYLNPFLILFILGTMALEKMMPVDRTQRILSAGVVQDFVWFNADIWLRLAVLPLYLGFLHGIYDRHLSFLTLDMSAAPGYLRGLFSFLLVDFLNWLHHFIRHKVGFFWQFHTVHHSQREMNLFTESRIHFAEQYIVKSMTWIPLFMFQADPTAILGIALFMKSYPKFYHANIKTNLGILKHVLVTPQSHRIHHSPELRHRDRNFGVILSVWDRLFGTLYTGYDEYPETGIEDPGFPLERSRNILSAGRMLVSQLVYPFQRIWKDITLRAMDRKDVTV